MWLFAKNQKEVILSAKIQTPARPIPWDAKIRLAVCCCGHTVRAVVPHHVKNQEKLFCH